MSKRLLEEMQEQRQNKILGNAIGLSPDEVAEFVTDVEEQSNGGGLIVYFAVETPQHVRDKVSGLGKELFIYTGPIDFDEYPEQSDGLMPI
ncbi:hypothetical protein [Pseudomonas sp. Irchel s3b2]|uniref:hypothetical protein n=1 Tax=Pseudomonas sp. Irchel s3b2 TaxID=2009073 RepID=UPI001140344F|nr:hypothetical protein [Pseudomonas sp. Irchel s3b2]